MTSHCTSLSASRKWPVIAGRATLTAMSSGASEAPRPTMARPSVGCFIVLRTAGVSPAFMVMSGPEARGPEDSKVLTEERHHALPGLPGRGRIVGGAHFVGEGVLGVVAEDL